MRADVDDMRVRDFLNIRFNKMGQQFIEHNDAYMCRIFIYWFFYGLSGL